MSDAEQKRTGEDPVVAAALAGDERAFAALTERHRRELQVHCYRMLGSFIESEDLVQETFLRAWRRRETFEGRSTYRAWLYRIATNACLDLIAKRPPRVLPPDVVPAADPDGAPPEAPGDLAWLEPYPDHLIDAVASSDDDPDAALLAKETMELAFLAAIQHLPPKQRAVMILRDVLGWSANETADLLETTVPSVKSALQRARGTLKKHIPPRRDDWAVTNEPSADERTVLEQYMRALEADSTEPLAALLREDVRVSYAPLGIWADGRDDFITASSKFAPPGEIQAVATNANRQPAVAMYLKAPGDEVFRLITLEVLRIERGLVVEIIDYSDPELLEAFGLPATL